MVQIRLKRKYRVGGKSRFSGGEKPAPKKKRNKIGHERHVKLHGEQPVTVLHFEGVKGKGVFITSYK